MRTVEMMKLDRANSTTRTDSASMSNSRLSVSCASSVSGLNERTPMSTLYPTSFHSIVASLCSHYTLMWLCYPVVIAGHKSRSLSFGTGFFKLQLQPYQGALFLPLLACFSPAHRWSCNLKKIFEGFRYQVSSYRTPMTMLLSPLLLQHRQLAAHRCLPTPVASAGKCLPTPPSGVGPF